MPEDSLKIVLYGKTEEVVLADGKTYILREPDIDTLETLDISSSDINDMKTVKRVAWSLLEQDNPSLKKETFGKLLTLSMITEESDFMIKLLSVLGRKRGSEKKE